VKISIKDVKKGVHYMTQKKPAGRGGKRCHKTHCRKKQPQKGAGAKKGGKGKKMGEQSGPGLGLITDETVRNSLSVFLETGRKKRKRREKKKRMWLFRGGRKKALGRK